jgi:CubicO group peptidase (beta-lactamase class C family)
MNLLLVAPLALVLAASPASFPDTDPGRRAAAYLEAFNSGDETRLRQFLTTQFSAEAQARRPLDERLAMHRQLLKEHGRLTPVRVLDSGEDHVRVTFDTQHGDRLVIDFECEPRPPYALAGLRLEVGSPGDEGSAEPPSGSAMSEPEAVRAWSTQLDSLAHADAFSGAALLARGDSILVCRAWGDASRERHVPNRPDTKFNLGSINKIFTKLAIGQLVEQGKIKLDDTIDRYLADYPREAASRVTVRQLLEHRSGIGNIFGDAYDRADRSKLRRVSDWIPLFRDQPLAFEPGTKQQYSNGGYVLLGAIIEKVSGEDYYGYMRRHVYEPLGMKDTDHYASDQGMANLAAGYTKEDGAAAWHDNGSTRPMRGSPAGGGYSTLDDLLRFTRALRASRLLTPATLRDGFSELGANDRGEAGLGIGGGALGINASIELHGPYTIIVLANLDPPTAERAARQLRRWLPGAQAGGERVRMGAGPHGAESENLMPPPSPTGSEGAAVRRAGGSPVMEGPRATDVPAQGVRVAMSRSGHLPTVRVMVNGEGPFLFAIDTGAAGSARIDSTLAARLGLERVGQARSGDPSGRNARTVDLVSIGTLEIGGARFSGLVAAVRNDALRRGDELIDGILGFGLFKDCLLTLDYPGNQLGLEHGALPPANGADVIDFTARRGVPSVRLQVGTLWVDADVDAGAPGGFSLPASYADRLPLASKPQVIGRARTVGNEFEIRSAGLNGSVRLGGQEFPRATLEFQPVFPMANVGSRILSGFRVTFDQKNGRLRLVKPA